MQNLMTSFGVSTGTDLVWLGVGLLGQLMFSLRFLAQWIASERAGKSVVPIAFWYFSILGSLVVFTYGIHKRELVIIIGQVPGCLIYARNLWLIRQAQRPEVSG